MWIALAFGLGMGCLSRYVASWYLLKRKVDFIRFSSPIPEIILAMAASILTWRYQFTGEFWTCLAVSAWLLCASLIDLTIQELPDSLTLGGTVLAIPLSTVFFNLSLPQSLAGMVVGSTILLPLNCFRVIGMGDVKLMLLLGALLGIQYLALYVILLTGLLALLLLGTKILQKMGRVEAARMPFGPILALVWFLCALRLEAA